MNVFFLILLRLIHVVAGALWIGAAVFYLFFLKPSVKSIGPAGPQFMQNLVKRRKYPVFMLSVSLLTVLAGGVLYFYTSKGFFLAWLQSGPGIGFTIGSLAALVAFLVGGMGISPTSARMGALGEQMAKAGGPPAPEQLQEMHALEAKLNVFEIVDFSMLALSMVTMATARYWVF
jgi:uncharacterized membrane protein